MRIWNRLFRKKDVLGYRVGELPESTPGEVVLFKMSFIEPLLKDVETEMATAGAELPKEEQIIALAAKLAGIPQDRLHRLLDLQADGRRSLVRRVVDLQNAFSNPKLPDNWAVPGYIVTLFRFDRDNARAELSNSQKCSECGKSLSTFSMHGMAGPAQALADMMEDRALFCSTCRRTFCTRCGMKVPGSAFICPGCGGEITFAK